MRKRESGKHTFFFKHFKKKKKRKRKKKISHLVRRPAVDDDRLPGLLQPQRLLRVHVVEAPLRQQRVDHWPDGVLAPGLGLHARRAAGLPVLRGVLVSGLLVLVLGDADPALVRVFVCFLFFCARRSFRVCMRERKKRGERAWSCWSRKREKKKKKKVAPLLLSLADRSASSQSVSRFYLSPSLATNSRCWRSRT